MSDHFTIIDGLTFDESGNLHVVTPAPDAPVGTLAVHRSLDLDTNSTTDDVYTITSGETLTVQLFTADFEPTSGGTVCELFIDDDGTGTTLETLAKSFVDGSRVISTDVVGDGSRAIRLRARPISGGAREIFTTWTGFESVA